jgi:uncharacterized protein (TIGR02677 family)
MNRQPGSTLRVFTYVNTDRSELYRAIMRIFMEAKSRFALHLRPADIAVALQSVNGDGPDIDSLLRQLCEWGNLDVHPDTSDVSTVEEFYRPRHLYQLSAAGEAAERALQFFVEALQKPGELQTAALDDIRNLLGELDSLATLGEPDEAKVHRTLKELTSRFEELTSRAHTFIGSLQRTIDLHGIELDAFLVYKDTLIEYLERFIGELTVAAVDIANRLMAVEAHGIGYVLEAAAKRELVDAFNPTQAEMDSAAMTWRNRWDGLRSWFIRQEGAPSQAEVLRACARSAIPPLLNAVANIHDRRTTRSDRAADLRTLALWFAQTDSDQEAHRLWRAAFALSPSRHLRIDEVTLEHRAEVPIAAATSWLDAPPIAISPRLRKSGRHAARGPARAVIDLSKEKALLAKAIAAEAEQLRAARQRLATGQRTRLSEIGHLTSTEFSLFLDLLGETLSKKVAPQDAVEASSSDGAVSVRLCPTGDGRSATIETESGRFSGLDHFITITDVFTGRSRSHGHERHTTSDNPAVVLEESPTRINIPR